jgi:hypothetical protein
MEYLVAKKREADVVKELKKEERCKRPLRCRKKGYELKERTELKRELEEERIMNTGMSTFSYKQQ